MNSNTELVVVAAHDMGGGAVGCPDNPDSGPPSVGGIVAAGFQPMHLNANGSISPVSTQAESTAIVLNASYPTFDNTVVNWTGEHVYQWQFLFENTGDTNLAVRLYAVCMGGNGNVIRTSP